MAGIDKQAEKLNELIKDNNPTIYNLLSKRGKSIFFPTQGILGQTTEAKGKKINATIGLAMENNDSPFALSSLKQAIDLKPEDMFSYAPSYGKPELRKIWQEMIYKKNPSLKSKITLPIVSNGITHGLSMIGYLFVNPEDKIILTDKFWGNYKLIFENTYQGSLETFNTFKDNRFDTDSLRKKLAQEKGKKIVLLNFPNNPTGYTPTIREAEKIVEIMQKSAEEGNEIIVIVDDAYFGLVYQEGILQESLFASLAGLAENILTIKLDGASKEEYAWGFRVGFITLAARGINEDCCQALESKIAGAVRATISNVPHLSQSLILKAIASASHENEKREKYDLLQSRFDTVQQILKNRKYAEFFWSLPCNSGYFICLELKKGLEAEKIRQRLLNKYDTGIIATNNLIRIAFSSVAEQKLPSLFENIYQACHDQLN